MDHASWDGHRWDSLATRISDSVAQTWQFLQLNGQLFTGGNYIMELHNGKAWSRPVGGAFFIVFDENYQIYWATPFGEYQS